MTKVTLKILVKMTHFCAFVWYYIYKKEIAIRKNILKTNANDNDKVVSVLNQVNKQER